MKNYKTEKKRVTRIIKECRKMDFDSALNYYDSKCSAMSESNQYKILRAISKMLPKVDLSKCQTVSLQELIESGDIMTEDEYDEYLEEILADKCYSGAFWVVGESLADIKSGNFHLLCYKRLTDYDGNLCEEIHSKRSLSHKRLWYDIYREELNSNKPYNFYPRGRVGISKGVAYINIIEDAAVPLITDAIIREYKIDKLKVIIRKSNKFSDGGHRNFLLK